VIKKNIEPQKENKIKRNQFTTRCEECEQNPYLYNIQLLGLSLSLSLLAFSYSESPLAIDVSVYTAHKRLGEASNPKGKENSSLNSSL